MESPAAARVLLVEDDAKLAKLVKEFLEASAIAVEIEPRGDRAAERILKEDPDLVILDLMLPGKDGLSICREVRPRYRGSILMLTALDEELDEVVGLEIGADDYLAKPVRPRVLLARVSALLRRRAQGPGASAIEESAGGPDTRRLERIDLGYLVVDAASRSALVDGKKIDLTTSEFDLLLLLARHAGEVLSRERIYGALRGIEYDGLDRSIDLRIARLRRKLGDDGKQPQRIKSVRGVGYLLVVES